MKTQIMLAVLLAIPGTAFADGISSRYVNGDAAPAANAPLTGRTLGYAGSFGMVIDQTESFGVSPRFGDAAMPSTWADPAGAARSLARASMLPPVPGRIGVSPRITGGSN